MKILWTTELGLFALSIAFCQGLEIRPRADNGTTAVEEGAATKDFVFSCLGLNMFEPIVWKYQDPYLPASQEITIANCSTSAAGCTSVYSPLIRAYINEHTGRSHMIIPDVLRGRFPDGTWACENGGQRDQCDLDVIYTPKDVQCQVTVNEDKSTVTGVCQASKMYSSLGQYSCQWFEGNDGQTEAEIPPSETNFTLTNCSEGLTDYYCGNCSFHKSLPLASQSYLYRVVISPGKISPSVAYTIGKTQSNGTSLAQVNSTTSANPVTPVNPVTSDPVFSLPVTLTTLPDGVTIDDGMVTTARYEGIGIGAALLLVVASVVAIVVFVVYRCRRHKEKTDGGFPTSGSFDADYDRPGPRGDNCNRNSGYTSSLPYTHSPPAFPTEAVIENEYSSIRPLSLDAGRSSTGSYLTPVPAPGSIAGMNGFGSDKGVKGGSKSGRTLPDLPDGLFASGSPFKKNVVLTGLVCDLPNLPKLKWARRLRVLVVAESNTSVDTTGPPSNITPSATGISRPEVRPEVHGAAAGHTDHKARRDHDVDMAMRSLDLPASKSTGRGPQCNGGPLSKDGPGNNGGPLCNGGPLSKDGPGNNGGPQCNGGFVLPAGDCGEERTGAEGVEEKENTKNERMEEAAVSFLSSGFQEKGADYIYMKPENIPLSELL